MGSIENEFLALGRVGAQPAVGFCAKVAEFETIAFNSRCEKSSLDADQVKNSSRLETNVIPNFNLNESFTFKNLFYSQQLEIYDCSRFASTKP